MEELLAHLVDLRPWKNLQQALGALRPESIKRDGKFHVDVRLLRREIDRALVVVEAPANTRKDDIRTLNVTRLGQSPA
jgi:hypothetical protein